MIKNLIKTLIVSLLLTCSAIADNILTLDSPLSPYNSNSIVKFSLGGQTEWDIYTTGTYDESTSSIFRVLQFKEPTRSYPTMIIYGEGIWLNAPIRTVLGQMTFVADDYLFECDTGQMILAPNLIQLRSGIMYGVVESVITNDFQILTNDYTLEFNADLSTNYYTLAYIPSDSLIGASHDLVNSGTNKFIYVIDGTNTVIKLKNNHGNYKSASIRKMRGGNWDVIGSHYIP